MKGMGLFLLLMILAIVFGGMWNSIPIIKDSVHAVLDPSFGVLLDWNKYIGMFAVVFIITMITTVAQKYLTDQATLKQIKAEQKVLQEEMKKYKNNPEKLMEFQKKQLEFIPKTFEITTKPMIFTFLPIILFFRWFNDYFSVNSVKFFGFISWFWFYLIFAIIFSSILRKIMKVY